MRDDEFGAPPKKRPTHEVGQDLSTLSEDELGDRIALLREEIVRIEEEARRKAAVREAARAFFKA